MLLPLAALAGFLGWNWAPARIFMGDVGSTALGALAVVAVLAGGGTTAWCWYYPVVALPLVGDAACTLVRRLLRGEDVLLAHRSHLYQRLVRAGWPHGRVASAYVALTLALGLLTAAWGGRGAAAGVALTVAAALAAERLLVRLGVPFSNVGEPGEM